MKSTLRLARLNQLEHLLDQSRQSTRSVVAQIGFRSRTRRTESRESAGEALESIRPGVVGNIVGNNEKFRSPAHLHRTAQTCRPSKVLAERLRSNSRRSRATRWANTARTKSAGRGGNKNPNRLHACLMNAPEFGRLAQNAIPDKTEG